MNICVCGGGNLGHVISGYLGAQGLDVNILTRHPEKWSHILNINVVNSSDRHQQLKGTIGIMSSEPSDVIPKADLVIICLPGPHIKETLEKINPYLKKTAIVGSVVSNTGFFIHAHEIINNHTIFGFQRVPFISRIVEYGKKADLLGTKKSLSLCVEGDNKDVVRVLMEDMFHVPVKLLSNFFEVSLSNSNPLLHPARMYTMWHDWKPTVTYERIPLFYSEWTDVASQLLIDMDEELQRILKHLPVDPSNVPPILDYYESNSARTLTDKIKSIPAFSGIMSPMKEINGRYVPDIDSRYFKEDFECGTFFMRDTARSCNVPTPCIDTVCEWYENIRNVLLNESV